MRSVTLERDDAATLTWASTSLPNTPTALMSASPATSVTMTKRMLAMEWAMSVEEAIEAEAVAQALCMTTEDFARAYHAFSERRTPVFEGD